MARNGTGTFRDLVSPRPILKTPVSCHKMRNFFGFSRLETDRFRVPPPRASLKTRFETGFSRIFRASGGYERGRVVRWTRSGRPNRLYNLNGHTGPKRSDFRVSASSRMKNSSSEKSADEYPASWTVSGKKKAAIGSGKVGAQCPNPWNANCRSLSTYGARSKITGFAADASRRRGLGMRLLRDWSVVR